MEISRMAKLGKNGEVKALHSSQGLISTISINSTSEGVLVFLLVSFKLWVYIFDGNGDT